MVSVEEPEPGAAMPAGLKLAVAPAGKPEALSATLVLKLPLKLVLTVVDAEPPCTALNVIGDALIEKSSIVVVVVATSREKSSMMKEVCSPWSSVPTR